LTRGGADFARAQIGTMNLPLDASGRTSAELSALIDKLANDPAIEEPITLGLVRSRVARSRAGARENVERLHFDREETLLAEIESLIEAYGEEAPAVDFETVKASEALSRVIEAILNDANTRQRPTLAAIREAVLGGVAARLVGDGAIDPDEGETLLAEIDSLIERFNANALAERFVCYE
jgi:hypothetical protein